jgi:hypothetical protein
MTTTSSSGHGPRKEGLRSCEKIPGRAAQILAHVPSNRVERPSLPFHQPTMPALRRSLRSTVARLASGALLALVAWACSAPSLDTTAAAPTEPLFGKAPAAGLTVSSTRPAYADRGTTVDVHVIGTGFAAGAQATWLLHGVADPAKVRTNGTTYVSSTEVVANITVSSDADLAFWDVQIMAAGGKNGVGTEVFEITTAQYLGPATAVYALNDGGQIAGINGAGAFVYDPSFGMLTIGDGQAWGIDPLGAMVLGRTGSGLATAWVRQGTTTSYVAQQLPMMSNAVASNAAAAARDAFGTLIVGGWQSFPAAKKSSPPNNWPAIWRYEGSWSTPTSLPLPAGSTSGSVRDINAKGQAVGRMNTSNFGVVWDDVSTVTALDGLPMGINPAGTLAVGRGGVSAQPVYWYRTASGNWNTTGVTLPSLGGSCGGDASAVNAAGVIVGKSCDTRGNVQATVWRLDLTGPTPVLVSGPQRLPGLGGKGSATSNETSAAVKVSSTAPYTVAGYAMSGGSMAAVRWLTW